MSVTTTIFALFALYTALAALAALAAKVRTTLNGEAYWWSMDVDGLIDDMPSGQEAWAARHIAELEAKHEAEAKASILEAWDASIMQMTVKASTKRELRGLASLVALTPALTRAHRETVVDMLDRVEVELFADIDPEWTLLPLAPGATQPTVSLDITTQHLPIENTATL